MNNDISIALLQEDIGCKLNSEEYFANINVQVERKELYSSEEALATVWMAPKGGVSGAGVIVAMPRVNVQAPNGPLEFLCKQMLTVYEEPNINQNPATGTQIFAEDIGAYLVQLLHEFALFQNLTIYADGEAMVPNRDCPGIRGVDVHLNYRFAPAQLNKCATVPISFADGQCTLACATAGASLYYTTDGTFPAPGVRPDGSASTAQTYAGPFAVKSGMQVRAAAACQGMVGSDAWAEIAP